MNQEDQNRFRQVLRQFWASKGISQMKIPQIGGQELDLLKLYKSVCQRGGGQSVSNKKLWKQIVDEFGLPSSCTSASYTLKNHYQKYLLAYEQKYFFGKDDDAELPELVAGRLRKQTKQDGINRDVFRGRQQENPTNVLTTQLARIYQKSDKNQMIYSLKRSKLYPQLSEVKRVVLGLESGILSEIVYSLNTLTLYSVNTHTLFSLEQYPNVIDSLCYFIKSIYPPKKLIDLEHLRSICLILRNMSLTPINTEIIHKSPILDYLPKIYFDLSDRQCNKHILDIFNELTKFGWNPQQLIPKVFRLVQSIQRFEETQSVLDFIRTMLDQNIEGIEPLIIKNMQHFSRFLLSEYPDIRELSLEIVSIVIDSNNQYRLEVAKNTRFVNRVVANLSSGTKYQKLCQFSALILNNLIQNPQTRQYLQQFQSKFAVLALSTPSIEPVAAGLLIEINKEQ